MIRYEAFYDNDEIVSLPNKLIDKAAKHGVEMRKTSVREGHQNKPGYDPDEQLALKVQALGAVCEMAIAFALCIPVKLTSETFNVPDLPHRLQVRLIGVNHYGLRVYDRDDDDWIVIGVVIPAGGERLPYRVPGWIRACNAKRHPEWSIDPHNRSYPMYAVPQRFLRPLSELRSMIYGPEVTYPASVIKAGAWRRAR